MIAMLAVMMFAAGFVAGDAFGSRRWKRAADEALALAADAVLRRRPRETA
ncbi:hypothetical protein [Bosea sp. BK604]|nr:hypothetical protein [Bosea sp. BK604]TCR65531.1 hypothetical protein EV560_105294 [Bosea sp. BK604]